MRKNFCRRAKLPRHWKNICWSCGTIRKTIRCGELAADLCLSQNRGRDAVRLLGELFERQVNAGDATRASLTYKKLARHGTPTWEQKFRFGQLLEGSNKKLAVGTYESALGDLAKLPDKKKDALQILGRVVALDPVQANFLRIAELLSELGESKAAAEAFKQIAQLAASSGERSGAVV